MTAKIEYEHPDWEIGGRVHNWKNHVPEGIQAIWETFNLEQKKWLYSWAKDIASNEEWE